MNDRNLGYKLGEAFQAMLNGQGPATKPIIDKALASMRKKAAIAARRRQNVAKMQQPIQEKRS